jgi:uncharacterized protein
MEHNGKARRGLVVFLLFVLAGTAVVEGLIVASGKGIEELQGLVFVLMWVPGLASIITRLALREGFGDVSLRFGGRVGAKALGLVVLYPLVVGALAYGAAWTFGLATWVPPGPEKVAIDSAFARFLVRLVVGGGLGTLIGLVFALGEELGWRGFMLTRLIDAGVPRPVLVSGVIWGLWHVPLIATGQYASGPYPALSVAVFIVDIVAASYLYAYVRLKTGSVWSAVLAHATWNAVIQGVFDRSTENPGIWVGESGILVAIVDVAVVAFLVRGVWPVKRDPRDASAVTSRALAL